MLSVVAPHSTTAASTSSRYSGSVRAASSGGELDLVHERPCASDTAIRPRSITSSREQRSLCCRWMSDVARKMWIRFRAAGATEPAHVRTSCSVARASPQIVGPSRRRPPRPRRAPTRRHRARRRDSPPRSRRRRARELVRHLRASRPASSCSRAPAHRRAAWCRRPGRVLRRRPASLVGWSSRFAVRLGIGSLVRRLGGAVRGKCSARQRCEPGCELGCVHAGPDEAAARRRWCECVLQIHCVAVWREGKHGCDGGEGGEAGSPSRAGTRRTILVRDGGRAFTRKRPLTVAGRGRSRRMRRVTRYVLPCTKSRDR